MFIIKADIMLTNQNRKRPIEGQTYRPLLFFGNNITRSGLLVLQDNELLEMDKTYENRLIKLYFYKDLNLIKEFFVGREFILAEGGEAIIGKGVITEVIGEEI